MVTGDPSSGIDRPMIVPCRTKASAPHFVRQDRHRGRRAEQVAGLDQPAQLRPCPESVEHPRVQLADRRSLSDVQRWDHSRAALGLPMGRNSYQ